MAAYKSYAEKLKDPRWQRKRLEIMERDGFACVKCGSKDQTLNVHHGYYEKGKEPWDYKSNTLWTVCQACHEQIQEDLNRLHFMVALIHPSQMKKLADGFTAIFQAVAYPD